MILKIHHMLWPIREEIVSWMYSYRWDYTGHWFTHSWKCSSRKIHSTSLCSLVSSLTSSYSHWIQCVIKFFLPRCFFINVIFTFITSGKFNSEELGDLQTEFNHHRDKLKEYNRLLKILVDQDEISENSVFSKANFKEEELKKLRDKLQDTHASLSDGFAKLKEKATGENVQGEFRDPRVSELWERAQKAKFTEEELDSIKVSCWVRVKAKWPMKQWSLS